jgi:hypothetical protein
MFSLFASSSNKSKAKGSNIGDAIVELLLFGGMPASIIEARLVESKKLELGAGGNQNKCVLQTVVSSWNFDRSVSICHDFSCRLSRSLQKLQRAGILSKVICFIARCAGLLTCSLVLGTTPSIRRGSERVQSCTGGTHACFLSSFFVSALDTGGIA